MVTVGGKGCSSSTGVQGDEILLELGVWRGRSQSCNCCDHHDLETHSQCAFFFKLFFFQCFSVKFGYIGASLSSLTFLVSIFLQRDLLVRYELYSSFLSCMLCISDCALIPKLN